MEIKQLRYFVEVARREHISEAALELNIAQSAISRQINLLEKELQVPLFDRQGRNIYLTSHGKALLTQATHILEQLDETVALFQQEQLKNAHHINLDFEESYASHMITPIIQTFEREYDSHIIPSLMNHTQIVDYLNSGKIDIAIVENTPELQANSTFSITSLYEETYHLYVPKDDAIALTFNPPLTQLKQFEKNPLYTLHVLPDSIKKRLESVIKVPIYTLGTTSLGQYLLKQRRGHLLLPDYISLDHSSEQVEDISLAHTELKRSFCVVFKKDNKKVDIFNLFHLIQTLLSKVSTYH